MKGQAPDTSYTAFRARNPLTLERQINEVEHKLVASLRRELDNAFDRAEIAMLKRDTAGFVTARGEWSRIAGEIETLTGEWPGGGRR